MCVSRALSRFPSCPTRTPCLSRAPATLSASVSPADRRDLCVFLRALRPFGSEDEDAACAAFNRLLRGFCGVESASAGGPGPGGGLGAGGCCRLGSAGSRPKALVAILTSSGPAVSCIMWRLRRVAVLPHAASRRDNADVATAQAAVAPPRVLLVGASGPCVVATYVVPGTGPFCDHHISHAAMQQLVELDF